MSTTHHSYITISVASWKRTFSWSMQRKQPLPGFNSPHCSLPASWTALFAHWLKLKFSLFTMFLFNFHICRNLPGYHLSSGAQAGKENDSGRKGGDRRQSWWSCEGCTAQLPVMAVHNRACLRERFPMQGTAYGNRVTSQPQGFFAVVRNSAVYLGFTKQERVYCDNFLWTWNGYLGLSKI